MLPKGARSSLRSGACCWTANVGHKLQSRTEMHLQLLRLVLQVMQPDPFELGANERAWTHEADAPAL